MVSAPSLELCSGVIWSSSNEIQRCSRWESPRRHSFSYSLLMCSRIRMVIRRSTNRTWQVRCSTLVCRSLWPTIPGQPKSSKRRDQFFSGSKQTKCMISRLTTWVRWSLKCPSTSFCPLSIPPFCTFGLASQWRGRNTLVSCSLFRHRSSVRLRSATSSRAQFMTGVQPPR